MEDEFEQLLARVAEGEVYRAKWTQASREAYFKEHPENFAGPAMTYPIKDASDVEDAWGLAGHAAKPDAVRSNIKSIAKRLGLESGLPETAKEDDGKGRAMETDSAQQILVPITRIDKDEWVIEGTATNDSVDHYGTVFDYESSKKAFDVWGGNIREMHDHKKAVGRAIKVTPNDDDHSIFIRARISKGAKDTWEKICDGTLNGFSIGVPAGKYKVKTVERAGKTVPMYYDHTVGEVSIVDSVGTPGCDNVAIVRADGMLTEVLDDSEEENAETPVSANEIDQNRAGAKISHVTQGALHGLRDSNLKNARDAMALCAGDGCQECQTGMNALDPDGDGDIDLIPNSAMDWDNDGGTKDMMAGMRTVEAELTRLLAPTLQRYNAIAAQFAQYQHPEPQQVVQQTIDLSAIERRFDAIEQLVPGLAEVRSLVGALGTALNEVKELTEQNRALSEQIAAQPQGGGPIANSAAMEKILATQGVSQNQPSKADVARMAAQYGLLNTEQSQLAGAQAQIAEMFARTGR